MSVIHHVSVGTNDLARALAFYDPIMAHLGLRPMATNDRAADFGVGELVFSIETPADGKPATVGNGVHIAFAAGSRDMVDEFHRLALASGGSDAGAPGIRYTYDAHYYGAFVHDPDGNKIEAVTYSAT